MIEEALLVGFEGRARRGFGVAVIGPPALAGDIGRLQGGGEIIVDDLEGRGVGVIDADLLLRKLMLQHLDFDARRKRGRGTIESQRLQVARQHFHRRDAARLHGGDEILPRREGHVGPAPQAKPRRIGEIGNRRRARRRDIEDAGVGQGVLQPQAGASLLRGGLLAALALIADGVRQRVGLVENDDAVECPPRASR